MKKQIRILVCIMCSICMFIQGYAVTAIGDGKTNINNIDSAARLLLEMNILEGYAEGDLKLDCEISRAEFAKMVYVLINGVDDSAEQYVETTAFQDMQNHWARAYAEYAQQSGLMVGANGNFRPNDTITIAEVTKVILCILGFDAEENGLIGGGWKEFTIALGKEHGLFAILPDTYEKKATRRNVCEIFNYLLRDVKHSSENVEEYGVIIESSYDISDDQAIVKLGFQHEVIKTFVVGSFYVNDKKYPNSKLNDTAEQFAENRKFGYVYRYKINEDGTVDLSLERGVAPRFGEDICIFNGLGEEETKKGFFENSKWIYPLKTISTRFILADKGLEYDTWAYQIDQNNVHFESRFKTADKIRFKKNGALFDTRVTAIITEENDAGEREVFLKMVSMGD